MTEDAVQDLNWVLASTIQKLIDDLGPDTLRSCLSQQELSRIERRLSGYGEFEFDPSVLRKRILSQLNNLSVLASDPNLVSLAGKIETLFAAAATSDAKSNIARSALLYLADIADIVPDSYGLLGLVDDIYVIEWAYAVVEDQTRCLPLLEALIQKWPYIADLSIREGDPATLDRYNQYVASVCLYSLFDQGGYSLLVLRESGACAITCALMAAICSLRMETAAVKSEITTWVVGQPITISDGVKTFKATFDGKCDFGNAHKYRIGVRRGSITVDVDRILPYIARSPKQHVSLSTGNDILKWQKEGHPDPLTYLTGSRRRSDGRQKTILLVCSRLKLDLYLSCFRPMGSSIPALLGVRYVTARNRVEDLTGSVTDRPAIYATSDAGAAIDLIREPPADVEGWYVIIDGARTGYTLLSSVASSGIPTTSSFSIIGELHEREAAADLMKNGVAAWYLEDQDVEAPPLVPKKVSEDADALVRSTDRQVNHWTVSRTIYDLRSDFLEKVAGCMTDRAASSPEGQREFDALDLQLSSFLRKAISYPIRIPQAQNDIGDLAERIVSQSSVLRAYDPFAGRVHDLFSSFVKNGSVDVFNREADLGSISADVKPNESAVVVCRSAQIAEACDKASADREDFKKFSWLNLEKLRQSAPYDRVIVPGWLDRMAMRELNNVSYGAQLDLLLLPFEQKWFSATVAAGRRWELQLETKTCAALTDLTKKFSEDTKRDGLWREQLAERITAATLPTTGDADRSDVPEIEKLETRAIEALERSLGENRQGRQTAKAQLVLFDDADAYAFLPPTGRVIVLSPKGSALDETALARGAAENLLFRSVTSLEPGMILAFPTGGDRDLVDARADQYLQNPERVRSQAALWKVALRRHLSVDQRELAAFSEKLAAAGEPRAPSTIGSWITQTHSVAPRNYRAVVPLIAQLTKDTELGANLTEALRSIDLVYRARERAAEAIVRELFSGQINLDSDELVPHCCGLMSQVGRFGQASAAPPVAGDINPSTTTAATLTADGSADFQ